MNLLIMIVAVVLVACGGSEPAPAAAQHKPQATEGQMPPAGDPLWAIPPDRSPLWQEIGPDPTAKRS